MSAEGIESMKAAARAAREGSLKLNELTYAQRQEVLRAVADALDKNRATILAANAKDMQAAADTKLAAPLLKRLELSDQKIDVLVSGIRSIAEQPDPLGRVLNSRYLDDDLLLVQQTASIGVLLIIFESRPDSLPQIAALALSSGNGLLLKGGREAEHSNSALHRIIVDAVRAAAPSVPEGIIGLITNRAEVYELLRLDGDIDLVIPRGGNAMVKNIQQSTNIPVLGHADGICHVYLHEDAGVAEAVAIATDAKLNYPAACNAAETLLLNEKLLTAPDGDSTKAAAIVAAMAKAGVRFLVGPALQARPEAAAILPASTEAAATLHMEYGDNQMTVEVVPDFAHAIRHINTHGSHHTDCIVTGDGAAAAAFEKGVDSACVFRNCSTRFADGYRFGLGAEVGISTSRIHARGPVGVEGLLTMKWVLAPKEGAAKPYATVEQFQSGERAFTHKPASQ
uniref:glutamate-5-semialdehyde dehydrogenase n=1 Tax=Herpetomonas muscarum TaxID=5718 RepID=U5KL68_HERMU|nr:glutamate-5-semialdehyde dehydrogenase [Herpetomonas muscarum]